ncbi:hypothetical protein ACWEVY_28805 [Streptomyces longwoodensis]
MSEWVQRYDGLSNFGSERGKDYRGYVVRVNDGEPPIWYTYAFDQEDEHTYWIGSAASEDEAKAVLERMLSEGWKCELYDRQAGRHCRDTGVMVKSTWTATRGKPQGTSVRLILCEPHGHVFPKWERMTIREYVNTYNALEQDAPIMGPRL